jgi:hypothetical protein
MSGPSLFQELALGRRLGAELSSTSSPIFASSAIEHTARRDPYRHIRRRFNSLARRKTGGSTFGPVFWLITRSNSAGNATERSAGSAPARPWAGLRHLGYISQLCPCLYSRMR